MSDLVPKDRPLSVQKKVAEDLLTEAFARDLISMDEFENRLGIINAAGSNREIQTELQDLPESLIVQTINEEPLTAGSPKQHNLLLSSRILRGIKLREKRLKTRLVLAEETLDYSKTVLEPGTYYVDANVILSELKIIVPENYTVSLDMTTVLSEVIEKESAAGANSPHIVIRGKAILGSVKVKVRKDGIISKIIRLLDS